MKYIKHINEGFTKKFEKWKEILKSVWFVTEEDLFYDFSEVTEQFDVDFEFTFQLKSPKGNIHQLKETKVEVLEGYAAAGFEPQIIIEVKWDVGDVRKITSVMTDCLFNVEDYYLEDVKKSGDHLKFTLGLEKEDQKSKYHKKGTVFFNKYFEDFKKLGYDTIVNKLFDFNGKFTIKHKDGANKLYTLIMEKTYSPGLEMIDSLSSAKQTFLKCLSEIQDEFGGVSDTTTPYVSYDFEIDSTKGLKAIFSIAVYEDLPRHISGSKIKLSDYKKK